MACQQQALLQEICKEFLVPEDGGKTIVNMRIVNNQTIEAKLIV